MAKIGNFIKVYDPANPSNWYEVVDQYAREQLVHKVEKTIVNSLPAKPTCYDGSTQTPPVTGWLQMEPFLYYVPIEGQENDYHCYTLFFVGDPSDPLDYTDQNNYVWALISDTDVNLDNFSTKGHTHEVIPETEVADHEYTPQGLVNTELEQDDTAETSQNGIHKHSVDGVVRLVDNPSHNGFSGTSNQSTSGGVNLSQLQVAALEKQFLEKVTLKRKKASITLLESVGRGKRVAPTTDQSNNDITFEDDSTYVNNRSVFGGITVDQDGGLSFNLKKPRLAARD